MPRILNQNFIIAAPLSVFTDYFEVEPLPSEILLLFSVLFFKELAVFFAQH